MPHLSIECGRSIILHHRILRISNATSRATERRSLHMMTAFFSEDWRHLEGIAVRDSETLCVSRVYKPLIPRRENTLKNQHQAFINSLLIRHYSVLIRALISHFLSQYSVFPLNHKLYNSKTSFEHISLIYLRNILVGLRFVKPRSV